MIVKLLTEHYFLHMSKCHIVGNLMLRLVNVRCIHKVLSDIRVSFLMTFLCASLSCLNQA